MIVPSFLLPPNTFVLLKDNIEAVFSTQVNVVTQRGFIPVDERMRVIDGNGKLVCFIYILTSVIHSIC